jgi:excisionase family DNA binding protein
MFTEQFMDSLAVALASRVVAQMSAQAGPPRRLMSVDHAAEYIGRSKQAKYHLISQGKIPTKRQGSRVFTGRKELDRWIDELPD